MEKNLGCPVPWNPKKFELHQKGRCLRKNHKIKYIALFFSKYLTIN
jgi:hypothetical protein